MHLMFAYIMSLYFGLIIQSNNFDILDKNAFLLMNIYRLKLASMSL